MNRNANFYGFSKSKDGVNRVALVPPSPTDDAEAGFRVGNRWVNFATGTVYFCVDSTPRAAIWKEMAEGSVAHTAFEGLEDNAGQIIAPDLADNRIQVTDDGVINADKAGNTLALSVAQGLIDHDNIGGVSADDHHSQIHVLAGTGGLGPDHTVSGLTAGQVLKALTATTAAFAQLLHSQLGGIGANDHHSQIHVLAGTGGLGPDHTVSGLTAGQVLKALTATTAAFQQLTHSELGGVSADQHHAGFIGLEDNAGAVISPAVDDRIQITDDTVVNADKNGDTLALSIDVEGQTEEASPSLDDKFLMQRDSDSAYRSIALRHLLNRVSADLQGFRLTASDGNFGPTAGGTLYLSPYKHAYMGLYNTTSGKWSVYGPPGGSISLSSSGLTSDKNYDIFAYESSGSIAIEALAWTDDSTRATAITKQDGVYVKSGDASRRYIGTIRTDGSSNFVDNSTRRFIWNVDNRIQKHMYTDYAVSHTYTTASWRLWNNNTAARVQSIRGLGYENIKIDSSFRMFWESGDNTSHRVAVGVNTTSVPSSPVAFANSEGHWFLPVTYVADIADIGLIQFNGMELGDATSPDFEAVRISVDWLA